MAGELTLREQVLRDDLTMVKAMFTGNGPASLGRQLRFTRRDMLPYDVRRQRVLDAACRVVAKGVCLGGPQQLMEDARAGRWTIDLILAEFARLWGEQ